MAAVGIDGDAQCGGRACVIVDLIAESRYGCPVGWSVRCPPIVGWRRQMDHRQSGQGGVRQACMCVIVAPALGQRRRGVVARRRGSWVAKIVHGDPFSWITGSASWSCCSENRRSLVLVWTGWGLNHGEHSSETPGQLLGGSPAGDQGTSALLGRVSECQLATSISGILAAQPVAVVRNSPGLTSIVGRAPVRERFSA